MTVPCRHFFLTSSCPEMAFISEWALNLSVCLSLSCLVWFSLLVFVWFCPVLIPMYVMCVCSLPACLFLPLSLSHLSDLSICLSNLYPSISNLISLSNVCTYVGMYVCLCLLSHCGLILTKEWNFCARANLHLKKKKSAGGK